MYREKLMIKKVAKRRLLAKVAAFLVCDLDGYAKLFYRSQKGLTRKGYKDFKRKENKKRRSREKMALRAWMDGNEQRFEKYLAEEKKSLMWYLW